MTDFEGLSAARLREALQVLGDLLEDRGLRYDVVMVGGANLLLRDVVQRTTMDADLIGEYSAAGTVAKLDKIPDDLRDAATDIARLYGLRADWLNVGPASLLDLGMPDGYEARLERLQFGGLTLRLVSTRDLVGLKLYAAATLWPDPGRHFTDLAALRPDPDALDEAATWCRTQDPSEDFADLLDATVAALHAEGEDD